MFFYFNPYNASLKNVPFLMGNPAYTHTFSHGCTCLVNVKKNNYIEFFRHLENRLGELELKEGNFQMQYKRTNIKPCQLENRVVCLELLPG